MYNATTVPLMLGTGADQSGDPNELGIPRTSIHRWLPKGQRGLLQRQAELFVNAQPQHEKSPARRAVAAAAATVAEPEAPATPVANGRRATCDNDQEMELIAARETTAVTIDEEPPTANKIKMYTDIF